MRVPVLPMLVGLSLCGISASFLFVYLRKRNESKKCKTAEVHIPKSENITCARVYEKVEVTNEVLPLIIGREGLSLKAIEDKTRTQIEVHKKDAYNQLCIISGDQKAVSDAQKIIKQLMSRPIKVTEKILVPQSACGKIIGRCGESLQEICRKSQAKVSVESGDRGDGANRKVLITGTQAQVNTAKLLIEEKVQEDAETRKVLEEAEAQREPRFNPAASNNRINSLETPVIDPANTEKLKSTNPDGQMEVYVSAIANPSKFWVQMIGPQCADLDHLVNSMTEYYEQTKNQEIHRIQKPYLGQIVAALFKYDNKWYRAEIVAILPNDYNSDQIVLDIYYVDYGDSAYVETNDVYQLRTDFLTLRFQAIECFLANVKPPSIDNNSHWDVRSIQRFEELTHVAQWKKLLSRVVCYREKNPFTEGRTMREGSPIPGVELYDPTTEGEDINISMKLVAEGLASSIEPFNEPKFGKCSEAAANIEVSAQQSPSNSDNIVNEITKSSSPEKSPNSEDNVLRFRSVERLNRKRVSNGFSPKT